MKPDYLEALTYKNLLLRLQADHRDRPGRRSRNSSPRPTSCATRRSRSSEAQTKWDAVPANAVRVGGGIVPPTKIRNVRPVYPPDALAARVAGVVIIEAVIGEDGKVRAARVLRSIPMLDPAAPRPSSSGSSRRRSSMAPPCRWS